MDDKMSVLKSQLYAACEESLEGKGENAYETTIFTQDDLLGFDIVPDLKTLLPIIGALTNEYLFQPCNTGSGTGWRIRSDSDANKYHSLTPEQVAVYSVIDSVGSEGIWLQHLRQRSGIKADQTVNKILRELDAKRLVTSFQSVENPLKKRYIKVGIKPSAKATGGAWYSDSDLDEAFVEMMLRVIYNMIRQGGSYRSTGGHGGARSASSSPVLPKKGIKMGSQSEVAIAAKGKKRSADEMDDAADIVTVHKSRRPGHTNQSILLHLPAGYMGYLTLAEITANIASTNITKGAKLKESDIKELLDVLKFDNRIEEIKVNKRLGYRVLRVPQQNPEPVMDSPEFWDWNKAKNGLTTAPCGHCPVFDLCEEGGPVWAGGCEYFDRWLS